jgi:hypothetical protein
MFVSLAPGQADERQASSDEVWDSRPQQSEMPHNQPQLSSAKRRSLID